jgi:hypothetical protein
LYVAVRVTGVALLTVPGVSVKLPDDAPCGIVRLAGMVTSLGDALSATVTALVASDVMFTEQVSVAGGVTLTELHEKPSKPKEVMVTVPPVSETFSSEPFGSEATPLVSVRAEDGSVVEPERVSATVATTPFPIAAWLTP